MKIYCDVLHVPYLHNLVVAFPEYTFLTPDWTALREKPDNLVVVNAEEYRRKPMDVVIDSKRDFINFDRPCRVRVKLLHMERGANSDHDETFIPECIQRAHAVVSVSEHKMWTFGESATKPTVVAIPFGVCAIQIGTPQPGLVGTLYQAMNDQQSRVWSHILKHFPDAELTGFGNPFPSFEPKVYRELNERFSRMDVFVHTVVGNSVGLSFAEAMMRGIPVVTGMNLDLPKELASGWNCVITRGHAYDCLDEMVESIKMLISDRKKRMRMGNAARETAKRIWGLDTFRTNWNHVFHNRLGSIL